MANGLSPEGDEIRRRIIDTWIVGDQDVDWQIDGLEAVTAAVWTVLATMTGATATRAVFNRALSIAARNHPGAGVIQVVDGGLDLSQLRALSRKLPPDDTRAVLVTVVNAQVEVLCRMVGRVLVSLLREIEDELAQSGANDPQTSRGGEE